MINTGGPLPSKRTPKVRGRSRYWLPNTVLPVTRRSPLVGALEGREYVHIVDQCFSLPAVSLNGNTWAWLQCSHCPTFGHCLTPLTVKGSPSVRVRKAPRLNALPKRWDTIHAITDWVRGEFLPAAGSLKRYARFLQRIRVVLLTRGVPGGLL